MPVAAFFGRVHFYEGHGMDVPALLPRLADELGAGTMVLTAAVGGLVPGEAAGTVVVLRDHLNLMGAAPLRGWRYPDGMPTFVSTTEVYDEALRDLAFERAQALGIASSVGVYAAMSGPGVRDPDRGGNAAIGGRDGRRHVDGARGPAGARPRHAGARACAR